MRDCLDVDLRDLLPDFAAERLRGADRARVAAHVATCVDCVAEVELLRAAAQAIRSSAPAVDVGRVVAALPKPPGVSRQPVLVAASRAVPGRGAAAPSLPVARRRPTWTAWRMAAVLSTVAVGSLSVAVLRDMMVRPAHQAPSVAVAPVASAPSAPGSPSTGAAGQGGGVTVGVTVGGAPPATGAATGAAGAAAASSPVTAAASAGGLAVAGGVSDLSDGEVEGLLQDLDGLDATPSSEPEPAAPGLHAAVSP
jgi:putative zinc finger protein